MNPLWAHQQRVIEMAAVEQDLALLMDPGVGKTRAMIETLRRKYATAGRIRKTLIFAPIVVCPNWKDEFARYSKVNPKDILVLTKSGKQRTSEFIEAVGEALSGNKIVVTNYQATLMKDLYAVLFKWQPEIVVCDESQRVKNPKAKTALAVAALAERSFHNYILTGTPVLQSAMDLFMQFRILDRGATFGKNFFAFREQYFFDKNAGMDKTVHFPDWQPRPQSYELMQQKIAKKSVRAVKSECLDLPPFIRQKLNVEMGSEQKKAYEAMRKDFLAFINDKHDVPRAVVAQLAVTKALRLLQIVSGFASDEHGVTHRFKEVPRLDAIKELLEDRVETSKIIVWAVFKENYRMLEDVCKSIGVEYAMLNGELSAKQKQDEMDRFRTDPKCRVIIANQSAGGVGVNLIESDISIYYSRSTRLEDDLQSEARNYRGGSDRHTSVTRMDLVTPGTIDELNMESLFNKQQIGEVILDWGNRV